MGQKIQNEARSEIEKVQREYFLREQLKAIQRELGEADEQAAEVEEFRKKIEAGWNARRGRKASPPRAGSAQAACRLPQPNMASFAPTWIGWFRFPGRNITEDNLDIPHARQVLDQDHYGLEDVKERILEYLAVRKLRQERADELAQEPADEIHRLARRCDPVLCRTARRWQDIAGPLDCPCHGAEIRAHLAGRDAR